MSTLLENSIIDIIKKYYKIFLNKKNVTSIGLGNKIIKNINTKEPCLRVLVRNKVPLSELKEYDIIPTTFLGVKVDVVQPNFIPLSDSPSQVTNIANQLQKLQRPIQAGFSIGEPSKDEAGTLGAIVFDNNDDTPYILSNNHVIARDNKNKTGFPIIQPSLLDGGTTNNVIAHLYKKVIINFNNGIERIPENYCDGAIAKIDSGVQYTKEIFKIGAITGTSEAKVDIKVKKVGRTTGYTEGVITSIHAIVANIKKTGIAIYKDVILSSTLGTGGDSGSLVLNSENKAIGLYFGNNDVNGFIVPIDRVLNYFNIYF